MPAYVSLCVSLSLRVYLVRALDVLQTICFKELSTEIPVEWIYREKKSLTTFDGGSLGSRIDEERSQLR